MSTLKRKEITANSQVSGANTKRSIIDSKQSPTNVNDISHFFSQKNATPQTNIIWAQTLRGTIDHDQFRKKIETIPNNHPRVYDLAQSNSQFTLQKRQPCSSDLDYSGNISDFKSFLQNQNVTKQTVNYTANLRDYKIGSQKLKNYQFLKESKSTTNDKIEENINQSVKLQSLEKSWNNLPKIDKKEFFNFNTPKCQTIQEGIKYNNDNKYAQYKGMAPRYNDLPKYSENFGDKNSYNFIHFKNSNNSTLTWAFGLRHPSIQKERTSIHNKKFAVY